MADLNRNSTVAKSRPAAKPSRPPPLLDDSSGWLLYILFIGTLYRLYTLLMQLVRARYKGEKEGMFQAHRGLMLTTVFSILVAGITAVVLFLEYLPTLSKDLPRVVFKIAKIVFFFSFVIAFITLLLVLFL